MKQKNVSVSSYLFVAIAVDISVSSSSSSLLINNFFFLIFFPFHSVYVFFLFVLYCFCLFFFSLYLSQCTNLNLKLSEYLVHRKSFLRCAFVVSLLNVFFFCYFCFLFLIVFVDFVDYFFLQTVVTVCLTLVNSYFASNCANLYCFEHIYLTVWIFVGLRKDGKKKKTNRIEKFFREIKNKIINKFLFLLSEK